MSNILNSEDFGLKIYNRFPPKYREDDVGQNFALKRYLQALSDGGFKYSIDEINGIADLKDPDKVDSKVLPILFKQYGLDIFNGIPEEYLRYLLPKLGEAWTKKGSLRVIEFITSSITGVKTDTEVKFDSQENPLINVKFEMDYNLKGYFPESNQFMRLLENFVPFYCDLGLVYSYLFYENQILVGKDEEVFANIHENKSEKGLLGLRKTPVYNSSSVLNEVVLGDFLLNSTPVATIGDEVDEYIDRIIYNYLDNYLVKTKEEVNNIVHLSLITDLGKLKSKDTFKDTYKFSYSESAGIKLRRDLDNPETNAILNEAILAKSVLGVDREYYDDYEDIAVDTKVEKVKLFSPVDSITNKVYNTLNSGFYTNSIHCYDKITTGTTLEVNFYS